MRYWSTTHRQWQTLITDAWALTGPQGVDPKTLLLGKTTLLGG